MSKAEKVHEIMKYALYRDEELENLGEETVFVEGIVRNFGFHPDRLEEKREEVKELLGEMAPEFHVQGGGGQSFLRLVFGKKGHQWAEQPTAESLMCLGMGLGMVAYCPLPRNLWHVLPGGVPYLMINTDGFEEHLDPEGL